MAESQADVTSRPTEPPGPDTGDPRLRAWRTFLEAHAAVTRKLEAELVAEQDLTLADYDALVQLAQAPDHRLRMSELAERVLLSRSGVSRLVDRLEADGLVERTHCEADGRGAFACLTSAGLGRLRSATPTHLRGVARHFLDRIPIDELGVLAGALREVAVRGEPASQRPGGRS